MLEPPFYLNLIGLEGLELDSCIKRTLSCIETYLKETYPEKAGYKHDTSSYSPFESRPDIKGYLVKLAKGWLLAEEIYVIPSNKNIDRLKIEVNPALCDNFMFGSFVAFAVTGILSCIALMIYTVIRHWDKGDWFSRNLRGEFFGNAILCAFAFIGLWLGLMFFSRKLFNLLKRPKQMQREITQDIMKITVQPLPDGQPHAIYPNVVWKGGKVLPAQGYTWASQEQTNSYRVIPKV